MPFEIPVELRNNILALTSRHDCKFWLTSYTGLPTKVWQYLAKPGNERLYWVICFINSYTFFLKKKTPDNCLHKIHLRSFYIYCISHYFWVCNSPFCTSVWCLTEALYEAVGLCLVCIHCTASPFSYLYQRTQPKWPSS